MKIIVMLFYIGGHGGPAAITGFDSLESCNTQKSVITTAYTNAGYINVNFVACVELNK